MAERGVVEGFVEQIAGGVQDDTVVAVCTPWVGSPVPPRVLRCAAPPGGSGTRLTRTEAAQLSDARVVLVPCNLQTPGEEEATKRMIRQLAQVKGDEAFMLLVLVLEEELRVAGREAADIAVERHRRALLMGCDGVIVDPPTRHRKFNESIELAHLSWTYNVTRCKAILESESDTGDVEYLKHILRSHARLLWDTIPRAMLRNFPPCDPHVLETPDSVGHLEFSQVLATRQGTVLRALDRRFQTDRVIKVTEKAEVVALFQVEDIYREFMFLKCHLSHPNITKCLQLIHTPSRLYMILSFCGSQNLKQFLHDQPNKCLEGVDLEACCKQFVGAVAHCHSRRVAHRIISLEHIVVMRSSEANSLECSLVDFRKAMESSREGRPSRKIFGALPCIAPEMARGDPYMPLEADCWSAGIVLLEMAGGLGAVQRAVGYGEEDAPAAATSIECYFEAAGSHQEVLSQAATHVDPGFVELAEALVRLPAERADMQSVAADLKLPDSARSSHQA